MRENYRMPIMPIIPTFGLFGGLASSTAHRALEGHGSRNQEPRTKKEERQAMNRRGQIANRSRSVFFAPAFADERKIDAALNRMTNWQRHQWWRAGGARKLGVVQRFAEMQRRPKLQDAA